MKVRFEYVVGPRPQPMVDGQWYGVVKYPVPVIGFYDDGTYIVVRELAYRDRDQVPDDCTWLHAKLRRTSKTIEAVLEYASEHDLQPILEIGYEKPVAYRLAPQAWTDSAPHARTTATVKFFDGSTSRFQVTFLHMLNHPRDRFMLGEEQMYGRFPRVEELP